VYAQGYQGDDRLEAGFGMFRALPLDVRDNEASVDECALPVLAAFSEFSHATVLQTVAGGLLRAGATDVRTAVIPDCGHWPAEEQPAALVAIIREFAMSLPPS
jgi:pimeloyl-ACP methyl ester carboxylesterase